MDNYLFSAIACCLILFIIGGIYFALHDSEKPKIPALPSIDIHEENSENVLVKCYTYFYNPNNPLFCNLKKVNLLNPASRETDMMDHWFRRNTEKLYHNGNCLAYINHYGHIEATFWKNISELGLKPEEDKKFQLLLISSHCNKFDNCYYSNFKNLLFNFGKRYQLLPEVLKVLDNDSRFACAKETYEFARKCST